MIILSIRTDKPEAEIGLLDGQNLLAYEKWPAHRQLAETLHGKIQALLKSQDKAWDDVRGIVCFKGPGSFTGLRIGLSTGNALAHALTVPIVSETGEDWLLSGVQRLQNNDNENVAMPEYGEPAHITAPRT